MQLLQGSILRKYSLDVSGNVVEIWSQLESSYPVRYQDVYIDVWHSFILLYSIDSFAVKSLKAYWLRCSYAVTSLSKCIFAAKYLTSVDVANSSVVVL